MMSHFEYNKNFLTAALPELQSFLLSEQLNRSVAPIGQAGFPPYPQLTPGAVLLFQQRLRACANLGQQAASQQIDEQIKTIKTKWRSAWEKKAELDYISRLKLWLAYLDDYRRDPVDYVSRYGYEVQRRTQLGLLLAELPSGARGFAANLDISDAVLRSAFVSGDFVWDQAYQPGFPQSEYWYLYGALDS